MVGAELLFPERYNRCKVYITELGWEKVEKRDSFVLRQVSVELRRRWNRIGVRCWDLREKLWAESFWMVIR